MDWTEVALEEYKTLRAESLAAIEQSQRTLQGGILAISVITGFALDLPTRDVAVHMALAIGTPAIVTFLVVLRVEELQRSVRAGEHLARLERKVAAQFQHESPPLTWESGPRVGDTLGRHTYLKAWTTTALLFTAALPVIILSLVELVRNDSWDAFAIALAGAIAIVVMAGSYQAAMHGRIAKMREGAVASDGAQPAA